MHVPKRQWMTAAAAALVLAGPAGIPAQLVYEANYEDAFRQMERDVPSLYLINGLFLTAEQNDQLAVLLEKVRRLETSTEQKLARLERKYAADLTGEAGGALRGRGGPKAPLLDARREVNDLQDDHRRKLDEYAREVWELLTPAQHEIVYSFKPCFVPAEDFRNPVRVGQAENDTQFGERILARLRLVPEERLALARERALEHMVPYAMHKRHIQYTEEAEERVYHELAARLDEVLPKLRSLADVDYELEKKALARYVLPVDEKAALAKDYVDSLWKTSAYVLNPGCLETIRSRGTRAAGGDPGGPYVSKQRAELREARDRFRAALLLGRLDLTQSQAQQVLPILRAGSAAAQELEDAAGRLMREAVFTYEDLKKELARQSPTPETERAAMHFHGSVKRLYEEDLVGAVRPYENQLDRILTAEQVAVLASLGGGRRAPGAEAPRADEDRRLAAQTLDRARKMKQEEFDRSKEHVAGVFVASCLGHGGEGSGVHVPSETARAVDVLEKARAMSRSQYSDAKEDLAVELSPRRMVPRPVSYGDKYFRGEPLPVLDESSRLLFTQAAVELLEKMGKP